MGADAQGNDVGGTPVLGEDEVCEVEFEDENEVQQELWLGSEEEAEGLAECLPCPETHTKENELERNSNICST